jgi:uncharacterized membrane protein YeaQ/YmgE (transglycosylase-associated protein family)
VPAQRSAAIKEWVRVRGAQHLSLRHCLIGENDMHFLWAIIAGLIIGLLAKAVLRGRQPIPLWLTIVLGIVGGLIGDYIATKLNVRHTNGVDWIRHILQVAAAAVLISLVSPLYVSRARRESVRY